MLQAFGECDSYGPTRALTRVATEMFRMEQQRHRRVECSAMVVRFKTGQIGHRPFSKKSELSDHRL
jgi:hypothetical protein